MSIERGQIYFVNLNPVLGREQAGKRLVLVLSINAVNQLPLVVNVVVGTKKQILGVIIQLIYESLQLTVDCL